MKNIYQRINSVMKEAIYVKKGSAGQGTGAEHDEVLALLSPHLVTNGIVIEVSKASESRQRLTPKGGYIFECDYNVSYVNIDEPKDKLTVLIESHAMDAGDKAPGKAITYAAKIAHLKVFSIETGESDESREEVREKSIMISQEQHDELASICYTPKNESGVLAWTPIGQKLSNAYKIKALNLLQKSKFDEALARCQKLMGANNEDNS